MGKVGAAGDNAAMESFFALLQKTLGRHTDAVAVRERVSTSASSVHNSGKGTTAP